MCVWIWIVTRIWVFGELRCFQVSWGAPNVDGYAGSPIVRMGWNAWSCSLLLLEHLELQSAAAGSRRGEPSNGRMRRVEASTGCIQTGTIGRGPGLMERDLPQRYVW